MTERRFSARNAYRKDKAKTKTKASPEFSGFCLSVISLLGFYCTIWPRHSGVSNYGFFDRLWIGMMDLAGVWWLIRRKKSTPVATEVT